MCVLCTAAPLPVSARILVYVPAAMAESSVLSLPQAALSQLTQCLEVYSPLGKDWKGLAGEIGFNARHTTFIEARSSRSSKTCLLLTAWDRSGRSSVEKLVLALFCLGRTDCLRILKQILTALDFSELQATADRIKGSRSVREKVFPPFGDDYVIIGDVWPASAWRPAPISSGALTSEPLQREGLSSAVPALSPEEEAPSLSANPSEATGVVPSKEKVFVSYFPDSSSRLWVGKIAEELAAVGLTVCYANDREMMDAEFKTTAITSSYNIVVFLTTRYCTEYQKLDGGPSISSNIKIDRTMIRDIFFNEPRRLIFVSLDQDSYGRCVPDLYRGQRLYRYPSQLVDLRHCVTGVAKFVAPPPTRRFSVEPTKIAFHAEVREFRARHDIPSPLPEQFCSLSSPHLMQRPMFCPPQTKRIVPSPIPSSKKSIFGKMFKKR